MKEGDIRLSSTMLMRGRCGSGGAAEAGAGAHDGRVLRLLTLIELLLKGIPFNDGEPVQDNPPVQ